MCYNYRNRMGTRVRSRNSKSFSGRECRWSIVCQNILGPMPWSKIMVTGGVEPTEDNLSAWFEAGVACVGMGSNLFPKEAIKNEDWYKITELSKLSLSIAKKYK